MKASELRAKSIADLQAQLAETRKTLLENTRALAAGELPNPRVVTKTRREIALIMTVLSEKSLETSKGDA